MWNSCDKNIVSGDILDDEGNIDKQEDLGFSGSFFKRSPRIHD